MLLNRDELIVTSNGRLTGKSNGRGTVDAYLLPFVASYQEWTLLTFSVSEEKNRWLRERMEFLGIREEDLEESFIRSSGKGGQHVNKSSTCVRIRHIPTGIEVKCMAERSQSVNRFLARRELVEKIALMMNQPTRRSTEQEKARRQKARRKRRSAEKYNGVDKDAQE